MPQADDVYPNSGEYFLPQEPEEQVRERQKEKAKTLQAAAALQDIITHLEQRIEFYNSLDSFPKEIVMDADKLALAFNANKLTRDNLMAEKEQIQQLLDTAEDKRIN